MTSRRKLWILALVGGAVLALVLLTAGLGSVQLQPGTPFYAIFPRRDPSSPTFYIANAGFRELLQLLLAVTFILTPAAVVFAIINPEARKKVVRNALTLTFAAMALFIIMQRLGPALENLTQNAEAAAQPSSGDAPPTIVAPEFITNPPPWAAILVTAVVLAIVLGLSWLFWQSTEHRSSELDLLADEARETIQEIREGRDLKNAVLRCYADMSDILREARGIRREQAMTPREFERRLRSTGLPEEPITRLTRLFETVRYGATEPGHTEEQEAIACLEAIALACGETV